MRGDISCNKLLLNPRVNKDMMMVMMMIMTCNELLWSACYVCLRLTFIILRIFWFFLLL